MHTSFTPTEHISGREGGRCDSELLISGIKHEDKVSISHLPFSLRSFDVCDSITCHIIKTTRGHLVRSREGVISAAPRWCLSSCHTPAARVCVQNSTRKHKTSVEHLNIHLTFLQGGEQLRASWVPPPRLCPPLTPTGDHSSCETECHPLPSH